MYRREKVQMRKLTPRDAERLLTINDFESQRPLKPRKINELANIMREGLFLIGEIAVAILTYKKGARVLMNGQHQCEACIVTNASFDVVYEEYTCDEPEDASLLFRQFDNSGVRSITDKVKVEMDSLKLDWSGKIGSLVVGAISFGHNQITSNQKVELLKHHQGFGEFVHELIGINNNGGNIQQDTAHMRRVPVVYAMLQTYSKHQEMSKEFWAEVRDGEGLKRNMSSYKLRNYLLTHTIGMGRGASGVKAVTGHEMVSKCVTAWNAFRKGITTDLKYYMDKPVPKAI